MTSTVLVATAGQGILRSNDDGKTWHRLGLDEPIEFDGIVRALAVDPATSSRIYAGADSGLCISDDGGAHWHRPSNILNDQTVWSIAIDPNNPSVLYAGTGAPSRAAIFKSVDAGQTWIMAAPVLPEFCSGVHRPRLLTICVDPEDSNNVWYGVEEGGAWRSRDAGANWTRIDGPDSAIRNSDIHAILVLPATAAKPKTTLVLTVNAVYVSEDDGLTWDGRLSRERFDGLYYTRTATQVPRPDGDLLMAIGDGTPGSRTRIYRSANRGYEWGEMVLATPPNSTFWAFGVNAAQPDLVYAGTKYGHLFCSRDGGRHWAKEWRDFSEITAVAWTPFEAPLVAHAQSTH
ncbi:MULTISPECIES: sialidase family protein [Paraburkholderia]|uniref:WD40/YVTN/BNR-like repeat-containing protein n=1 Tax=Paraburkholderia TaxID=1822464 RepID=UPI00225566A1|nr:MULTISPECIES: sialidase family protein [Paraburkholderia]MCX4163600.1 sialidase family protein [Paraburkholderia megapolitana]MDN7159095.1 glycoside hydrolase [Paraburkholderia sp. CHISQ3]MDQ6496142.1 glycoside hydrolase [Paraburkholderia megapolitana]